MIVVTALACLAALALRTPLRSRYWAYRFLRAEPAEERALYLAALCNAGERGRWGASVLLDHPDPHVRQQGVVVLHHVRAAWARARLLQLLTDSDDSVRELAALGLAIHGDARVIPTLRAMYLSGNGGAASAACVALERLETPDAVAALLELAGASAEACRRAALIDALAGRANPAFVPALLRMLSDHRECDELSRQEHLTRNILQSVNLQNIPMRPATARSITTEPAPTTVAERAAVALGRITGRTPAFSSELPAEQRQRAETEWADWYATHTERP